MRDMLHTMQVQPRRPRTTRRKGHAGIGATPTARRLAATRRHAKAPRSCQSGARSTQRTGCARRLAPIQSVPGAGGARATGRCRASERRSTTPFPTPRRASKPTGRVPSRKVVKKLVVVAEPGRQVPNHRTASRSLPLKAVLERAAGSKTNGGRTSRPIGKDLRRIRAWAQMKNMKTAVLVPLEGLLWTPGRRPQAHQGTSGWSPFLALVATQRTSAQLVRRQKGDEEACHLEEGEVRGDSRRSEGDEVRPPALNKRTEVVVPAKNLERYHHKFLRRCPPLNSKP